jgi:SulP family sulfate permease
VTTIQTQLKTSINFFLRPAQIFRNYHLENLRPDLIAGVTVAVILLPQAMAYAMMAELPPQMGIYTAIIGAVIGALWGSSNQLQTGPTNAASLLVLSILLPLVLPGTPAYLVAAGMLAFLVGVIRTGMGIARLGLLINFVSDSVIIGFTAGAGVLIFFNQLRNLMRLSVPSTPLLADTMHNLATHINKVHWISLALGVGVIFIILLLRRINPRIPGSLIGIILAAAVVSFFNLDQKGVLVIGELPRGLPPVTLLPVLDLDLVAKLSTGALAIAAIGLIEAMSIARSIAGQTGQRLDSNQEFIGQGLASMVSGFTSGYTCSGSFTRSAVNFQTGGKTPVSNVFSGLFVLFALFAFGSVAAYIPLTALAGVLIVVSLNLVNIKEMVIIWRGAIGDRMIMVVTLLATLTLPLTFAVLAGILMSLAAYLLRTSTPRVRNVVPDSDYKFLVERPGMPECPQLSVIEVLGDLYFGAVNHIEDFILSHQEANPSQRFLLLRILGVEQFDISGVHALERIVKTYRERNGDVYFSRIRIPTMEVMQTTGFVKFLGEDHFFTRDDDVIGHLFYRALDPAVCIYECPYRVFLECQNLPKRLDLIGDHIHLDKLCENIDKIKPRQLWKAMHSDDPPLIIDVREPREYHQGHIQGAQLVPLPDLLTEPGQVPDKRNVVFTCRSGRRSTRILCRLREEGYDNLMILEGGILAWEAENLLEAIDRKDG